jgi:hypothetical protein
MQSVAYSGDRVSEGSRARVSSACIIVRKDLCATSASRIGLWLNKVSNEVETPCDSADAVYVACRVRNVEEKMLESSLSHALDVSAHI